MNARQKLKDDPLFAVINEYLDANPGGSWDENRGVMRVFVWLNDRGYLKLKPIGESNENS